MFDMSYEKDHNFMAAVEQDRLSNYQLGEIFSSSVRNCFRDLMSRPGPFSDFVNVESPLGP